MKAQPSLLLLFGMPRSGTSWIGKIFDSHPRTIYRYEPDASGLAHLPFAPDISEGPELAPVIRAFAKALPRIQTTPAASTLPVFPKAYRSSLQHRLHALSVTAAKAGSRWYRPFPVLAMANYDTVPEICTVWKSIDSLGRIGITMRALEASRAIILLRHPGAYIASLLRGKATGQFNSELASEDEGLGEIMTATAGAKRRKLTMRHLRSFGTVERLAWHWILLNEKAHDDVAGLGRSMSLRYEDVCASAAVQMKRAFSFAGLEMHGQTVDFIRRSTGAHPNGKAASIYGRITQTNDSYYGVFKDPAKSANRWRKELTDEQIKKIYAVLGESDLRHLYPSVSQCVSAVSL